MGIPSKIAYEKDFYAWAMQQASFIKAKQFDNLDIMHLFDEVESMGKSQKSELLNRLKVLLMHLLKWKYQPNLQGNSWKYTIKEQRKELQYHLQDNPSLKNQDNIQYALERAYDVAVYEAVKETGLTESNFPSKCEWTIAQILDDEFYPN